MSSMLGSTRWFSAAWRFALLGSLASVPVTLGLTILYQTDISIAGGIVLFGAFMAGALATRVSVRSDVAGFRAGLLGAVWVLLVAFPALVRFASEVGVDWLGSPIATVLGGLLFVVSYATAMVFCGVVGSLCGRVGSWVTMTVTGRRVGTLPSRESPVGCAAAPNTGGGTKAPASLSDAACGMLSTDGVVTKRMNSPSDEPLLPESGSSARTDAGAYPNTIEDLSTGASITFLERGVDEQGAYLTMDGVLPPETDSGPARLHPRSEVRSEVMAGRADVTVRGDSHVLLPGESLTIAPGAAHSIRNRDDDTLVVRTTLRPPGEFEAATRALYETGAGGRPDLFAVAAVLSHYRADVRFAGLPWWIQRPILSALASTATMLGRNPLM